MMLYLYKSAISSIPLDNSAKYKLVKSGTINPTVVVRLEAKP